MWLTEATLIGKLAESDVFRDGRSLFDEMCEIGQRCCPSAKWPFKQLLCHCWAQFISRFFSRREYSIKHTTFQSKCLLVRNKHSHWIHLINQRKRKPHTYWAYLREKFLLQTQGFEFSSGALQQYAAICGWFVHRRTYGLKYAFHTSACWKKHMSTTSNELTPTQRKLN